MKTGIKQLEQFRITTGPIASSPGDGVNGSFLIPGPSGSTLGVIVSNGKHWEEAGLPLPVWEHVSVSLPTRCPTWEEMQFIKNQFWDKTECVYQFHVPEKEHVNFHPHVLHLWRPVGVDLPRPPAITVGPKT